MPLHQVLVDAGANLLGLGSVPLHQGIQVGLLLGIHIKNRSCWCLRVFGLAWFFLAIAAITGLRVALLQLLAQQFEFLFRSLATLVDLMKARMGHAAAVVAALALVRVFGGRAGLLCRGLFTAIALGTGRDGLQGFGVQVIPGQEIAAVLGGAWLVLIVQHHGIPGQIGPFCGGVHQAGHHHLQRLGHVCLLLQWWFCQWLLLGLLGQGIRHRLRRHVRLHQYIPGFREDHAGRQLVDPQLAVNHAVAPDTVGAVVVGRQVRIAIVSTAGQQAPSSFAWSANDTSTAFCAADIPCNGHTAAMMIVLIGHPQSIRGPQMGL